MSRVEPPTEEPRPPEVIPAGDPAPVMRLPEAGPTSEAQAEPEVEVEPEAGTERGPRAEPLGPDETRRRTLRRWAIAGVIALGAAVIGMGATGTPLFHAKTIEVEGARRLSERQVRRAAGVDGSTNVFSLDEEAVAGRLERNPWVRDAVVTTSFPSTIRIVVTERVPVAAARTEDGLVLVADDGSILGPAERARLPEIRVLAGEPAGSAPASVPASTIVEAAAVAGELGPALRHAVEAIVVQPDTSLVLDLRTGAAVTFGGGEEAAVKAHALRAILAYAAEEGKELRSADLRAPAAPTARFAGAAVAETILAGEPEAD